MKELFTIIGASGFIGSALVLSLESQGFIVQRLDRNSSPPEGTALGHAIFAAGVTADFRNRTQDTVNAHVCYAQTLLTKYRFESFTYLSSARLYRNASTTHEETAFSITPNDRDQLYDLSKLMGESLCLSMSHPSFRVVRLSNVAGLDMISDNFLPSLMRDALTKGVLTLRCAPDSAKDYVMLEDVLSMLTSIALKGKSRIYNLASGQVTKVSFITQTLSQLTGCTVAFTDEAPLLIQPPVNIDKLASEFDFSPAMLDTELKNLMDKYRLAIKERAQPN